MREILIPGGCYRQLSVRVAFYLHFHFSHFNILIYNINNMNIYVFFSKLKSLYGRSMVSTMVIIMIIVLNS